MGMVPINRKKVSLYEEAKNGLSSLVDQTGIVFVGFIFMLLLTGGNPSSFAISITFILGVTCVALDEKNRVTKLRKDSDGLLETINKRVRPQKRNRDLRVIQVNEAQGSVVIGRYLDKRNNGICIDFGVANSYLIKDSNIIGSDITLGDVVIPLNGVSDNNIITGLGGNDTIGGAGDDILTGGAGTDILIGQSLRISSFFGTIVLLKTIIEDGNLTDKSKADALGYLESIAEIWVQQNEKTSSTFQAKQSEP